MGTSKKERKEKKRIKLKNKKLVKKYPWLIPYNVWTGKISPDYDYEYTWYDSIPIGWKKAFGMEMIKDIDKVLKETNTKISIQQIKEKYGEFRFYCTAHNRIQDIISAYSHLSQNICIICGKPDVYVIDDGWISPYCKKCYTKLLKLWKSDKEYENFICDENGKMKDKYSYSRYDKDSNSWRNYTVDISEYANKIRYKYNKKHKGESNG